MKRPSGCLLSVLAIPLGILLFYSTNYSKKPPSFPHSQAAAVAVGLLRADEGFDWGRGKARLESSETTCPRYPDQPDGDRVSLYSCVTVFSDAWTRCGTWSSADCVALEAPYRLIFEPEAFGKVVKAIVKPCRYLPNPKAVANDPMASEDRKRWAVDDWRDAHCESSPERYPGKVILTLYEHHDGMNRIERLRIVKPAD